MKLFGAAAAAVARQISLLLHVFGSLAESFSCLHGNKNRVQTLIAMHGHCNAESGVVDDAALASGAFNSISSVFGRSVGYVFLSSRLLQFLNIASYFPSLSTRAGAAASTRSEKRLATIAKFAFDRIGLKERMERRREGVKCDFKKISEETSNTHANNNKANRQIRKHKLFLGKRVMLKKFHNFCFGRFFFFPRYEEKRKKLQKKSKVNVWYFSNSIGHLLKPLGRAQVSRRIHFRFQCLVCVWVFGIGFGDER